MTKFVPQAGRYIDPLTDFGFKQLFGNEPNKDILIDFLNQLFKGRKVISDLTYSPTEQHGDNSGSKKVFFDLLCTGSNGEQFIVEMQRGQQSYFKERAVFYTSRLISEQLEKGRKGWDYQLKEVYLIALLEFTMDNSPSEHYLHEFCLMDRFTKKIFYDKLEYKFIELPKFTKDEDKLETDLDRWLFILKNMSHLDRIPVYMKKSVFEKVFNIAEVSRLNKDERMLYDSSLKSKWDYDNSIDYATKKAAEKAVDVAKTEIVKNLLTNTDLPTVKIAALASVEEDFVTKILEEIQAAK